MREAAFFLENQRDGLGLAFTEQVESAYRRVQKSPGTWPRTALIRGPIERRVHLVDRFPYKLVYELRHDEIVVIAVAHTRRPGYWKTRRD